MIAIETAGPYVRARPEGRRALAPARVGDHRSADCRGMNHWHCRSRPRDRVSAQQDGSEDGEACLCVGGERWRALRAGPAIEAARPFRTSLRDRAEIEATVSAHPSRRAADVRKGQPGRRRAGGCFASRGEERQGRPRASAIRPTGKDRRARPGACSPSMRATAPDRLRTGASQTIGKRLVAVPSATASYPRSCQSKAQLRAARHPRLSADDAVRLEIGQERGFTTFTWPVRLALLLV